MVIKVEEYARIDQVWGISSESNGNGKYLESLSSSVMYFFSFSIMSIILPPSQ